MKKLYYYIILYQSVFNKFHVSLINLKYEYDTYITFTNKSLLCVSLNFNDNLKSYP